MTLTLPLTTTAALDNRDDQDDDLARPAIAFEPLPTQRSLAADFPLSPAGAATVRAGRRAIRRILRRADDRLLVIVGPCSVHNADAAIEYARRLRHLSDSVDDRLALVMRVYLEKPRTTIGWRGLVNDPHLDGGNCMGDGLRAARRLLTAIADLGLPTATELLDINAAAYLTDLVSFVGIGARTTESQPHRALASGLDLPVGFKNGTDGGLQTALDALVSSSRPHSYVAVDPDGRPAVARTAGNPDGVLILRGGRSTGPNYHAASVIEAERKLRGLENVNPPALIVDASHANSGYIPELQADVCDEIVRHRLTGTPAGESLRGLMLESHLVGGKQPLRCDGSDHLHPGVSVTDPCLGWDETETLLRDLHRRLS